MDSRPYFEKADTEVIPLVNPDAMLILNRIMEIQNSAEAFRAQAYARFRAAVRDIDSWGMEQIAAVMKDPTRLVDMKPPQSVGDIESPF